MFGILNNKVRLSGSDVVVPVSNLAVGTTVARTQFSILQPDISTVSGIGLTGPDGKQFGLNYGGSGLVITEAGTTRLLFQNGGNIGVGVTSAAAGFHIGSDLRVDGNFTVNGSLTTINTNATITHMLNVTNDGTGPAVVFKQTGAQPVMDVYDDSTLALRVADGGFVGINNAQPAQWLDVMGNMQSSGFQRSAYTIATTAAATLTGALPNVGPGALLGWNRNGTGAVCMANLKGTLTGGWEYVSYNADASFKQVCMTLNDVGDMLLAGSGSISRNLFLAGNSTLSGTVVTLSNLNRTGPRYSLGGPHENVYTTNDVYPVYQKLVWGHDNISMGFDAYFNGSQWLSGDTSTAFQIMKLSSNFMIRPSASTNTPGGVVSWTSAGLLMDSTGRVGVNATPAHTLDIGGDINAATNIVAGGTITTGFVNASTTSITGLATVASLSAINLSVNGQSSLTGNLVVGSSISAMALAVSTMTSSVLAVTGPATLSGNVMIGPGTLTASAVVVSQTASLSGLLTGLVTASSLSATNLIVSGQSSLTGNLVVGSGISAMALAVSTMTSSAFAVTGGATLSGNVVIGPGTLSASAVVVSQTASLSGLVTGLVTASSLSTGNLNVSGQSSLTGNLVVGSSISAPAVAVTTITGSALNVTGPSSLNGNVAVGPGTLSASALVVSQTASLSGLLTGLVTANSLSTINLNVSGQSSMTGNLAVGSNISGAALVANTITGSALNVTGTTSLSGNVSVGPGTLSASAIAVSQTASLSGLLTNNVSGSLLMRCYDESVAYANTTATAGNALPASFLTKPISQTQLTSVNLTAYNAGLQSSSYSARITGYIQCPSTGTFTFRTTYQDGATVWLSTDKLLDAWTFQGSTTQAVSGALVLRQAMWIPLSVEHAVAGGPERLLIEWNVNGGTYTTLTHAIDGSNFRFAYDMYEVGPSLMGTSYYAGRAVFNDTTYLTAGASLPNALSFTGNISELSNDAGFIASTRPSFTSVSVASYASVSGTLTAAVLGVNQTSPAFTLDVGGNINFSGGLYKGGSAYVGSQWTSSGTNLYFSGGNVGVATTSPQFTLDVGGNINFSGGLYKGGSAYVSSQWMNSGTNVYFSGGNVGINQSTPQATLDVAGSLIATSLSIVQTASISGNLNVGNVISNNVTGSLTMRVYDDSGVYGLGTLTVGMPLRAPFTTRPVLEQQMGTLSLTNATYGTLTAYSLRITGYIQPPATGTYLIRSTYRDGLSLYVSQQKLVDSWLYSGSAVQSVGTLTLYRNVWYGFAAEHAAASASAESLLIEWSNPGGSYTTMTNGSFTFAYDMKEVPTSLLGTSYTYGHANFQDVAYLNAGVYLPNATLFSGNTSELNNDAGFFKNTSGTVSGNALNISGTVSAAALAFTGTSAGTSLLFLNTIATVSGTVSTTAYGAFGVTPGTALDRYAFNAHRWWTGSTGTTSGTVSMQLSTTGLSLTSLTSSVIAGTIGSFAGTLTAQSLAAIGTINSNGIIDNVLVRQPNTYGLVLTGANTSQTGIANNTAVTIPFNQYSNTTYIVPSVAAWGSYNGQYLTVPVTGIWSISAAITVVASASNELFQGSLQQVSPSNSLLDFNYLLTPSTTNTIIRCSTVVKLQQGAQIAFRINSTFNSFSYYQQTINLFSAHLLTAM